MSTVSQNIFDEIGQAEFSQMLIGACNAFPKLVDTVHSVTGLYANAYQFDILGDSDLIDYGTQGTELVSIPVDPKRLTVVLKPYTQKVIISQFAKNSGHKNIATAILMRMRDAIIRRQSYIIIQALDAALTAGEIKNVIPVGTDKSINYSKLTDATAMLAACPYSNRTLIIEPQGAKNLLHIDPLISRDYVSRDESAIQHGIIRYSILSTLVHEVAPHPVVGTNEIMQIPKSGSDNVAYLYHKDAIGYAEQADAYKVHSEWNGDSLAYIFTSGLAAGATVINPEGIVAIKYDPTIKPTKASTV